MEQRQTSSASSARIVLKTSRPSESSAAGKGQVKISVTVPMVVGGGLRDGAPAMGGPASLWQGGGTGTEPASAQLVHGFFNPAFGDGPGGTEALGK